MTQITLHDVDRMLAQEDAFEVLSPYLAFAAAQADEKSASSVLLRLAGRPRRDPRWKGLLLPLLAIDGLRTTANYALGRDASREALDARFAQVERCGDPTLAVSLGSLGDPRALPYLLGVLRRGAQGTTPWALFKAMEFVLDASAVEPLKAWLGKNASHPEARNAQVLLQKAQAIAAGKPLPPPKAPDFEGFVAKLVKEGQKAVKTLAKAHKHAQVCAFAFDADPSEQYFAACFDDAARPNAQGETEVGLFQWHLWHEFELPVAAKLPKGSLPPSPSVQDGYVEHFFRPILQRACQTLANDGAFEALQLVRPFVVGYAYHGEPLVICATLEPPA